MGVQMNLRGLDDWLENGNKCDHGVPRGENCQICDPERFCVHGVPLVDIKFGGCAECDAYLDEAFSDQDDP